jgi:4-azaleucine resistance transporter AzlC
MLPIVIGVLPFGMIYGAAAVGAGMPAALAQAASAIIFAGSAQFLTAQLAGVGAPVAVSVMSAAIVNLRHLLYSASLAPFLRELPPRWRWGLAYLLTDEAYAVAVTRFRSGQARGRPMPERHWYLLGAGMMLWVCWQASTAVGVIFGARVPAGWGLDFALPLTFIALVIPALRDRADVSAGVAAGVAATTAVALPFKLGLLLGAGAGIGVGLVVWRYANHRLRSARQPT